MRIRNLEMDERAAAVDNESARRAFDVMTWLLVIDMGLRAWKPEWTNPKGFSADIAVIVLIGALTRTWFNWRASTLTERRIRLKGWAVLFAAVMAALLVWWGSRI